MSRRGRAGSQAALVLPRRYAGFASRFPPDWRRISLRPADAETQSWNVRWWDFLFYVLFGVAITMAVPVAGVLLVFTFLVVPALVAFLFTRETRRLIVISWSCSAIALAIGLAVSFRFDLPTGPVIVCTFGLVLLIAGAARQMVST